MTIKLYNEDCFESMKKIDDKSISLILTDPPYGITQNKWDNIPCLDKLWIDFKRIIKDNGCIVITAAQPFASQLVSSNLEWFKYEIIWEKTIGSGQLNIKRQPLRTHENVLIFYKKQPTYNEQKTLGDAYKINRKVKAEPSNYGEQKNSSKENDGFRHAKTVLKISNPRIKGGHPTQKPVELMNYFVKTFSNVDDLVFDPFMGSGTTGVSCLELNRNFIGCELDEKYFLNSKQRLKYESE